MTVKRFQSNFRERTDVIDQITPKVVVQRDISAPAGKWKPAAWLPVQFVKNNIQVGEAAHVISSGKVVALDSESRVVPAGMRLLLQGGAGALVYTATDAEWGVIDLVTGETVTGAQSYSSVEVAEALIERGLVLEQDAIDAGGTVPPTLQAHADFITDLFISPPVGFAAYDMYVWSGLPEDGDQVYTNLSYQASVQFLTEGQLQLPQLVAGAQAGEAVVVATVNGGGSATAADGEQVSPTEYWDATNLAALTRYDALGVTTASSVMALGLDPDGGAPGSQYRVARNTDRTPFTCDTAGVLVRERKSPGDISREGDWYLDAELGVLILHSDTWATGVAGTATWTFTYSYYDTAPASAHRHVHFDGPALPGRRVTFDEQSNFVMDDGTGAEEDILGRTLRVDVQGNSLLSSVKTGFGTSTNATFKMPGSATKGFTDLITLSGEVVADQVVILNVRI